MSQQSTSLTKASSPATQQALALINQLAKSPADIKKLLEEYRHRTLWKPFPDRDDGEPHPQRMALESKADILGYGGQAGGGKTDLLLGAARFSWRGIIFRRVYPSLTAIVDRSRQIYNPEGNTAANDSYNESLHRWKFHQGSILYFGSLQYEKDVLDHQGQPRDFYGFDELTEFTEYQFRFVTGWNRTTRRGQRCRIIATMNPPTTEEGRWVVRYFAPWLDADHPNPAKSGELRWFTTISGEDKEVPDGRPFTLADDGALNYDFDPATTPPDQVYEPRSRTFIFASVRDNPILIKSGYVATLQALPEPLRSIMLFGDFKAGMAEDPWQVIPKAWVLAAQKRWREHPATKLFKDDPEGAAKLVWKMSQLGCDVSRGGVDKTVLTPRYEYYVPKQIVVPGVTIKDGPAVLVHIVNAKPDDDTIVAVDVVGVGSSPYDFAKAAFRAVALNGAEKSEGRSKQGKLGFFNQRSEWYWRLREALDPSSGLDICLPDDPELRADLCVFKWSHGPRGIQVESKDDGSTTSAVKRLGRSPDKGDSLVYAFAKPHVAGLGLLEFMRKEAESVAKNGKRVTSQPASPDRFRAAMGGG